MLNKKITSIQEGLEEVLALSKAYVLGFSKDVPPTAFIVDDKNFLFFVDISPFMNTGKVGKIMLRSFIQETIKKVNAKMVIIANTVWFTMIKASSPEEMRDFDRANLPKPSELPPDKRSEALLVIASYPEKDDEIYMYKITRNEEGKVLKLEEHDIFKKSKGESFYALDFFDRKKNENSDKPT